jgi:hypothetical protein
MFGVKRGGKVSQTGDKQSGLPASAVQEVRQCYAFDQKAAVHSPSYSGDQSELVNGMEFAYSI